jgi:hypothetical protein
MLDELFGDCHVRADVVALLVGSTKSRDQRQYDDVADREECEERRRKGPFLPLVKESDVTVAPN